MENDNHHKAGRPKRIAIYARCSARACFPDEQVARLEAYACAELLTVVARIVDCGSNDE